MLDTKRGLVVLTGALVLSGCEFISISPDRIDENAGATITVSEVDSIVDECENEEVRIFYIDPETSERVDLGTGMAGAAGEDWSIEVPAPADRGSYLIRSECDSDGESINAEELIVQPPFAPVVDPTGYVVGSGPDVITVSGDFCITSGILAGELPVVALDHNEEHEVDGPPAVPFPTVTGVLGAEEQAAVATVHQPFDETWTLEFAAPTTPGLHTIDLTCTFFDYLSGTLRDELLFDDLPFDGPPIGEVGALDSHDELDLPDFITEEMSVSLLSVQVDGIIDLDNTEVDEGDSVTASNADSSPCDGAVTVQLLDGETVVDSAAPAVAEDGNWSATFDDLADGAYTVVAECVGSEEAGSFSYEPVVLSVAGVQPTTTTTTTTTTTVPSGVVASDSATPVRAQPAFTG